MKPGNAVTTVTLRNEGEDPLDTVRKAIAFADEMVKMGATVTVTGDLALAVKFEAPPAPAEDPE